MKIKKTYQGAVPLNRISNQENSSELNTYSTQYLNNKLIHIGIDEPTNGEGIWIQKGKNLFRNDIVSDLSNMTFANGVAIQVVADTRTDLQWKLQGYYDNEHKIDLDYGINFQSLGRLDIRFTKTDVFNRMRFGLNGSTIDTTVMVEIPHLVNGRQYTLSFEVINATQGSVSWKNIQIEEGQYETKYEEPIDSKILIKNDLGEYTELYNQNQGETYSFTERRIGTWVDNKPLYQRTLNVGQMPNNTTKTYEHGIQNVDNIYIDLGNSYLLEPENNNNTSPFTNNWDIQETGVYVSKTVIGVSCVTDYSDRIGIFTLKYTKTTD